MTNRVRGAAVATAVASLFMINTALAQTGTAQPEAAKVHCEGVNACKGQGACAGAGHDCAGKNACKGKGWIETTADECKAKGGTIKQ